MSATDLAIIDGRFAYCGPDASHCIGDGTKVVDARGRYLVPGLCDAHMHIESGMVTVTEFTRAVVPHGTTSMFVDPHEIANVLGLPGVRMMHDEAEAMPVNVFVQMPSCVPSAPGLEHAGASLGPQEIGEAMAWPNIIGLGEVMNFPGVAANDQTMVGAIEATVKAGKTVGGHYASPDLGLPFHGYVAGGPEDDHEGTRAEDAIARIRQGMKAMLRLGSAWYDVAEQIKAVTEHRIDSRNIILCTDDSHSGTLVKEGHMDRVVRHAIQQGLAPVTAIQMAVARGHRVFATAGSAAKVAACEALGAEKAILYREQDFVASVRSLTDGRGVDVILDMVGGDYLQRNIKALGPDGRHVSIAFLSGSKVEVNFMPVMLKRLTLTGSTLRPLPVERKGEIANALKERVWPLIARGEIAPVIHAAFPLSEAADAHRLMESSQHIGKIVLLPRASSGGGV